MIVVDHVYTYFALFRAMQPIAQKKLKIPVHIEIALKRQFTFDQLIDKNVHVPDNGHSARVIARCLGWVGYLRTDMV